MSKTVWILLLGGIATYFVHKTAQKYSWIVGIITILAAYFSWKK